MRSRELSTPYGKMSFPRPRTGLVPAPKQNAPNEAEVILQDSKKQDPETPKEIAECMNQWGPQTQMSREEWAASCRRTLGYFPEGR